MRLAADTKAYRRKVQRAFAVELLCPADEAVGPLGADPSIDKVDKMARAYSVSAAVLRNHLADYGRRSDIKFAA